MRFDGTVLQIVPSLDGGGAERTTLEIARAIVGAGGRALVASAGGRLKGEIERAGGRVVLMPVDTKNPLGILANGRALKRLVRSERVDIVHARSRAPAWSALLAARSAGAMLVTTYHGAYRAGSIIKRFYNSSMVRSDLIIANSQFTADAIRSSYPVGDRLKVIPRGADLEEFNPTAISQARITRLREEWGLEAGSGEMVILMPGRLTGWKGHSLVVDAAARLARTADGASGVFPAFQLIFAGDEERRGSLSGDLMRRVDELGLRKMIRWVGHCEDMPAAYALADLVLSPSVRPEAFGRVAAEAGAMEKIVIAAGHGGALETVADRDTGFLATPGSVKALVDAMRGVAAMSPQERRAMGVRARKRIEAHYSVSSMAAATIDAYQTLLRRKSSLQ